MAVQLAEIIQRGTRADQPAADTVCPGVLYYVTDELVTERSNGTTWDDYSDAGGAGGGAPETAEYIVGSLNATLTAERLATASTSITWDFGTAGQAIAKRAALTGDVTASADSNATTIAASAVTLAKMADIATDSLIGRDTASTGAPENILLNATLEMDGAGNLQRAALTGDVTASAGSNATTIANDAVTYAKMQNVSAASKLLGRGSAAGAGDVEEITIGSGLTLTGTSLSASAGSGSAVDVEEGGVGVVGSATAINFGTGFDVADAGGGQADVTLDLSEVSTTTLTEGTNLYYTDERAQDAVGTILGNTSTVNLTYADATPAITADVNNSSITYAKIQDVSAANRLLGRGDSGVGATQEITLGTGLVMTGTSLSVSASPPGSAVDVGENGSTVLVDAARIDFGTGFDVADGGGGEADVSIDLSELSTTTLPEGSNLYYTDERAQDAVGAMLVDSGTIDFTYTDATPALTAIVIDDSITYAKLQNISASDRLLGRDTAGAGNAEEITVSGGLEFTGSAGIQRSALTGDVTASAGSNATTIANDAVTYAKMQNVSSASKLLGRGALSGAGDVEEITLGAGLTMTGTTLSSSGGSGGGSAAVSGTDAISATDTTHIITHSLGSATALLISAYATWNAGSPYKTAQDANTITVTFPNECPSGGGFLDWAVAEVSSGSAGEDAVLAGAVTHVITHSLSSASAVLIAAYPTWNSGGPYKTAQDANTITVTFPNECPSGGGFIDWEVGLPS